MLAKRRTGAMNGHRQNGGASRDGESESSIFERPNFSIKTAGPFGENHDRHFAIEPGLAHLQSSGTT